VDEEGGGALLRLPAVVDEVSLERIRFHVCQGGVMARNEQFFVHFASG
jgi:hypothetical protein